MARNFKQLTYEQRCQIKTMLDQKKSVAEIAKTIGVHRSTIYNEKERGYDNGQYNPDVAHAYRQESLISQSSSKDPILSSNLELAQAISDFILKDHYSPVKIEEIIRANPQKYNNVSVSYSTIYNAIDAGLIPDVTRESLHSNETKVFNDGYIFLPKWLREKLDIKDGNSLSVETTEDGRIIFQKIKDSR